MAFGIDFRGFDASAAARPTSSVPPKLNAASTKTEQKPLKPWYMCQESQNIVHGGSELTVPKCVIAVFSSPISKANIPSIVSRDTTSVNDNPKDNKPHDCNNLYHTENKFHYLVLVSVGSLAMVSTTKTNLPHILERQSS